MSALNYNRSRSYTKKQIKSIQRVVGAGEDGIWGADTVAGVERWQAVQGLEADGMVGPGTFAAIEVADPGPTLTPIRHVGAWTRRANLNAPDEAIAACRVAGIDRLFVVINDFAKDRAAAEFGTFTVSKIRALAKAATAANMEVHLMSWIMPHAGFIDGAAESLVPLCHELGVKSLQWDAEEPWTQARGGLSYGEAAARIASKFASLSCPMTANGIAFTPTEAFAPLAEVCSELIPQCYATNESQAKAATVISTGVDRWRRKFSADKVRGVGLAAYKQSDMPGYDSVTAAMNAPLADARELGGIDSVIYWSLTSIAASPEISSVLAKIRAAE